MKESFDMMSKYLQRALASASIVFICAALSYAQAGSTRPRRVPKPQPTPGTSTQSGNEPLLDPTPATPVKMTTVTPTKTTTTATSPASSASSTARAYSLLQQKQFAEAAREAKQVAASEPDNAEAWKIAGFAEIGLQQYAEAASDLQKALDLQRAGGQEDANTVDALAQAYTRNEEFDRALPLLVTATTRAGARPDPILLNLRGVAEYRTGKPQDAERSFNAAVKANPKDAASLFYLGRIFYERNDLNGAIAALNRATTNDPRIASAWELLTYAYLRRAGEQNDSTKSSADYLSAVRAGEGLMRVKSDADAATLLGQALINAQQYPRAVTILERAAMDDNAKGVTLYLLGTAYSQVKNYPKAINALERAAAKTPNDANIYRLLGYDYEVSKQYAKALTAYEKGAQLAPGDADFKESADRVRPFAK
jgi:tetratricopeptide (TPR) repeat protein